MAPALAPRAVTLSDRIDAVIDALADDADVVQPIVDLLDDEDAWHWHGGRDLRDRGAVVESTGGYWAVAVIRGEASASRHSRYADADHEITMLTEEARG